MTDEVIIKADSVYKDFKLGHEKVMTMKSRFISLIRGKKNYATEMQHALKNINFEVKKGEFFGIVGRNGSGKSTLLKILAEIYQPTKGNVHVVGKLVPFIELGVGFNPELTGRDNVYLNGAILGFSKKEVDEFYDEVVSFAELERFMDKKLKNYSSGMQVRLAFSMATRAKADILLIDEVLAVGDADFQRKCFDYFKQLKNSDTTVVFVTHDMEAVREYCDRAMLINQSNVVDIGLPVDIAEGYTKLFNKASQPEILTDTSNRWGTRDIYFKSLTAKVNKKEIMINCTLTSKDGHKGRALVGFRIHNEDGQIVAGTSTQELYNKNNPLIVDSGKDKLLSLTFENILGKGNFSLSSTIVLSDRVTVCDNWDNFAVIKGANSETSYPILLKLINVSAE